MSRGVFEKFPGSGVFYVRYSDANGKLRREKAGIKSAAIALYHKRKSEALLGRKLPELLRRKTVTFSELADDALAYSRAHKRVYSNDICMMRLLVKWFGPRPASSVTPAEIEQRLSQALIERAWAPGTANMYRMLLSLTYRLGMRSKKGDSNPVKEVKIRREELPPPRWLRPEEEQKLRAAIRPAAAEHLPELDLAIHLGLRRSEQYNLRWEDVDLARYEAIIPRSKSGKARTLPLNSIALRAMKALRRRSDGTGAVCRDLTGKPLHSPRHWFEAAVKKAKIPHLVWRHLRHTFASRLVMSGTDIRTVQELMGHASILMTARYTHLTEEHKRTAVERLVGPTSSKTDPARSGQKRSQRKKSCKPLKVQ